LKVDDQISLLHKNYKLRIKKEKRLVTMCQILLFLAFIISWEVASRLEWIDPLIFSSPSKIWNLLIDKISDASLLHHMAVTLTETAAGFIIGTLAGTILASILWWSPLLSKILDPYLVVLNALPKVALGPILIVALGPGFTSIITMGAVISVIITTIVVYTSFREVDPNYLKVLQTFGATRKQIFQEAVFPFSLPAIISSLKVNVGLSWVGVIVGEYLVSNEGLGYLIIYGFQVFDFTLVFMSLVIIAVLAAIMYQAVAVLEKLVVKNRN
jgi:NitT/TauT family transport system permease protein